MCRGCSIGWAPGKIAQAPPVKKMNNTKSSACQFLRKLFSSGWTDGRTNAAPWFVCSAMDGWVVRTLLLIPSVTCACFNTQNLSQNRLSRSQTGQKKYVISLAHNGVGKNNTLQAICIAIHYYFVLFCFVSFLLSVEQWRRWYRIKGNKECESGL